MAEPLEINISKSFVEHGGKQWATYENGGGVTVQVWKNQQLELQRDLSYTDYATFREKAPELGLRDYPAPLMRRQGGTNANGNTLGRVVGETAPTAVPATQANSAIEAETQEEGITGEHVLDGLQLGLDVVGLIPVVGEAADIISAGISLARGDYVGAGLSLLSAIPFVGYAGTAGKATRYGAKMAEASGKVGKEAADRAAKEAADKAAKEAAERKAKDAAAHRQKQGAKFKPKKLLKRKPECFDPRKSKKYKKMNEAEQREYLREYARQLKRQEDSINNMSAKYFARARSKFNETKANSLSNDGRNPKAGMAQETYRRERAAEINDSIYESNIRRNPKIDPIVAESNATARTKEIMDSLGALHEPDMVAGGWYEPKPSALGHKGVNSAIGGSWGQKGRVKLIEDAANNAVARGGGSDIMNVELTICPPGKKGK
jgi:osmotically-inducible protein OsmY